MISKLILTSLAALFLCCSQTGAAKERLPSTAPLSSISGMAVVKVSELPLEAQQSLVRIKKGGPFNYVRDGVEFKNYEKRLPLRRVGYYKEYTVPTPGISNRGARRIVAGQQLEYYYTADHYQTFREIMP